jgi:hypothetical protein
VKRGRHMPLVLATIAGLPQTSPPAMQGVPLMAMMLAPLSLNHPAAQPTASGGAGPFSGGVAQNILPWNWFNNFTGNRFSWFTVNLGRSSAPDVEAEILDEVGSYGRQLGRIGDVLEVLVNKLPREALTPDELAAVEDFNAQMREIKAIKEKRRVAASS